MADSGSVEVLGPVGPTFRQRARQWSVLLGGALTALAAVSAHFQPETVAKQTAGAAAAAINEVESKQKADLAAIQTFCREAANEAGVRARAETDAVRELVLGYMLGIQQRGGVQVGGGDMRKALDRVVDQLGATKAQALDPLIQGARSGLEAPQASPPENGAPAPLPVAPQARRVKASDRLEQLAQ